MADSRATAVRFLRIVLGEVPVMAGPGDGSQQGQAAAVTCGCHTLTVSR